MKGGNQRLDWVYKTSHHQPTTTFFLFLCLSTQNTTAPCHTTTMSIYHFPQQITIHKSPPPPPISFSFVHLFIYFLFSYKNVMELVLS
jgi:hypothetical protein